MGESQGGLAYFVYEADEVDRKFWALEPHLSLIAGVSWDHHEIFPTREDYQEAFKEFISQSEQTILWQEDNDYLSLAAETNLIRLAAPAPVYAAVVTMVNAAVAERATAGSTTTLLVGVQVETAWGRMQGGTTYLGMARDRTDYHFLDALGI